MDILERIEEELKRWLETGEVKIRELGEATDEHWDTFIRREFTRIDDDLKTDPAKAYGHTISLAGFASHVAERHPRIVKIIAGYIHKFIEVMDKVKKMLGAESFSVTVSTPFDLSLSLTFS